MLKPAAAGPPPKVETVEAAKPKDYRDINTVRRSVHTS